MYVVSVLLACIFRLHRCPALHGGSFDVFSLLIWGGWRAYLPVDLTLRLVLFMLSHNHEHSCFCLAFTGRYAVINTIALPQRPSSCATANRPRWLLAIWVTWGVRDGWIHSHTPSYEMFGYAVELWLCTWWVLYDVNLFKFLTLPQGGGVCWCPCWCG